MYLEEVDRLLCHFLVGWKLQVRCSVSTACVKLKGKNKSRTSAFINILEVNRSTNLHVSYVIFTSAACLQLFPLLFHLWKHFWVHFRTCVVIICTQQLLLDWEKELALTSEPPLIFLVDANWSLIVHIISGVESQPTGIPCGCQFVNQPAPLPRLWRISSSEHTETILYLQEVSFVGSFR